MRCEHGKGYFECKDCIHWDKCSKKDGKTRYYGKQCAANNVEILCEWFVNTADVVPKSEVDDLRRYIILNEDIAIKCKRENGEQNKEYWKGKISAFRQIRAYIDAELKKKYTKEV